MRAPPHPLPEAERGQSPSPPRGGGGEGFFRWRRSLYALALVALLGCAAPSAPPPAEPSPSPATPTATPEPSPTAPPPTATPVPATPTSPPTPSPAPTPTPERIQVTGTDGQGANLREEPSTVGPVLKTLPDGAELTVVGPDQEVDGRVWRNVRDAEDAAGWMAAEVLAPLDAADPPVSSPKPADAATPCRPGQVKGAATTGLFYRPDHPDYDQIRERVRCFETEPQARASGFQPAP